MKAYATKKRERWLNCKDFSKKILPVGVEIFFEKLCIILARALGAYL